MKRKMYEELKEALQIDVSYGQEVCKKQAPGQGERTSAPRNRLDACKKQAHREQVLTSVRNMQAVQKTKKRIGFAEFVFRQIPFMGKELWMTQGAAAAAMLGILYLAAGRDMRGLYTLHVPLLAGILAVVLVMVSVPVLLMSYRFQMYEVELVSRISLPRLLAAKMILLAIEYMAVLVFSVGMAAGMADVSVVRAALYFLLPLLAACTGCVQIIRLTDGWTETVQRGGMCEGYCAGLAGVLIVIHAVKPAVYDNVRLWILLLVCIFPLFVRSVRIWVKESGEVCDKTGMAEI